MAKSQCIAKVLSCKMLQEGIYSMWLFAPGVAKQSVPGQFISLYMNDSSKLLPRPISLCEIDRQKGKLRIVFRVVGAGTDEFSKAKEGDEIKILGPLGNGFCLEEGYEKTSVVVGGGIGIPPILQLAKELKGKVIAVVGYRDKDTFLLEELQAACDEVYIATDDGSLGTKGTVIDALKENHITADVIFSCGPTPMLRGLKEFGNEKGIKVYVSMEEKMACGVGACLACVCGSTAVDEHSKVKNKRVCKDGPVFLADDVEL